MAPYPSCRCGSGTLRAFGNRPKTGRNRADIHCLELGMRGKWQVMLYDGRDQGNGEYAFVHRIAQSPCMPAK
jgi:hypothetical protein